MRAQLDALTRLIPFNRPMCFATLVSSFMSFFTRLLREKLRLTSLWVLHGAF